MRLPLLLLIALAPAAEGLAALDEGALTYEGAGTDTVRFLTRVRVEGEAPVEVRATIPEGFSARLSVTPAGRATPEEARALPGAWTLDPRAPDATWRGFRGVYLFALAIEAPNVAGRHAGSFVVAPEAGAGVAVPFTLDLEAQRLIAAFERGDKGPWLRVAVEGGKRVLAVEARAGDAVHPLARVAPGVFTGPVPPATEIVAAVTFWDGARLVSSPLTAPIAAPAGAEPAPVRADPPHLPEIQSREPEVEAAPARPTRAATPGPGPLALAAIVIAARFAR